MGSQARSGAQAKIAAAVAVLQEKLGEVEGGAAGRFLERLYHRAPTDELAAAAPERLAMTALGVWRFTEQRAAGEIKLRVFTPTVAEHGWSAPRTVVEIDMDDMPFLVDSVTAPLRSGPVHLVLHPVVGVERTATGARIGFVEPQLDAKGRQVESIMHIEIAPLADTDAVAAVERELRAVLNDVRAAVTDWRAMLAEIDRVVAELRNRPKPLGVDAIYPEEAIAFLEWMRAGHFTLLGVREYEYRAAGGAGPLAATHKVGLGILRDPSVHVLAGGEGLAAISDEVKEFLRGQEALLITKTKARSRVHRAVPMDYIGVKRYGPNGEVVGEVRFIGLFTAGAYQSGVEHIPLLRAKVAHTLAHAGFDRTSHDGRALVHVLDTFPRDELFQIPEPLLFETALGIFELRQRPRIRAFWRLDRFERFASVLVYVPREIHSTELRERIGRVLRELFAAEVSTHYTSVTDDPLARVHFILRVVPGKAVRPDPALVDRRLVEAGRRWEDELADALVQAKGESDGARLAARWGAAFPAGYREAFRARDAVADIELMETVHGSGALSLSLYRPANAEPQQARLKLFVPGAPPELSELVPMLENMGLKVIDENAYRIHAGAAGRVVWLEDLGVANPAGALDVAAVRERFHDAFTRTWRREVENDGFNRLVLHAGLTWREVVILRAVAKYIRQTGAVPSQAAMEGALAKHAAIAGALVTLFHARFDPARAGDRDGTALVQKLEADLDRVTTLEEDRILRRFLDIVRAMLRTNFYQNDAEGRPKAYVSLKLRSAEVEDLPAPKPFAEILVYAPRMEGIHLRGGRVARGGIRWSDRREDFRTEILGLLKAQMVKNAVIVPVGAKGGFVVKQPPAERDALQQEGIACYRMLINGMLDITDSLAPDGVRKPPHCVCHDEDDPYLVVAADKGTASFSDIANHVAREHDFWLDDAFASGGSAGYDHKRMGITARGAWESVRRHFRELGRDIQTTEFTVVGIGDMSGDVFGNGMLLSPHIRLVAAFNHLHLFVDPNPIDGHRALAERRRLFNLPRSAWSDYDRSLISPGGGVFERTAKSIRISPEMKARFGIAKDQLPPNELIHALLTADVDLLWNGGIGTYVKASDERHAEVGDRATDAVRVDGREVRAKVVAEGGNLGFTQRGRVEYALKGGHLNTDAVDNSAGVDCSDHEVNIKIATGQAMAKGVLQRAERDALLAAMTDEVAQLVLRDNVLQSQAISMMEHRAPELLEAHARVIRELERAGQLDRMLEALPSDDAIGERHAAHQGLTRPELAELMAYVKNTVRLGLLASDVPDDRALEGELQAYFPTALRQQFVAAIVSHRLRREIIATIVANDIVNRLGVSFVSQTVQETGFATPDVARAYTVVREVFGLPALWAAVERLDTKAAMLLRLLADIGDFAYATTTWVLAHEAQPLDIAATIARYRPGVAALEEALPRLLRAVDAEAWRARVDRLVAEGVPDGLARRIAALDSLRAAGHILQAAVELKGAVVDVADAFFAVGDALGLDGLRAAALQKKPDDAVQAMALAAMLDDLLAQQRALAIGALERAAGATPLAAIQAWEQANAAMVARTRAMIAELRAGGAIDVARLALASRQLRGMLG